MKLTHNEKFLIVFVLFTSLIEVLLFVVPGLAMSLVARAHPYLIAIATVASMSYLAQVPEDWTGHFFFPVAVAFIGLGLGLMWVSMMMAFFIAIAPLSFHAFGGIGIGYRFPKRWLLAGLWVCLPGMLQYILMLINDVATGTDSVEVGFVGMHYLNFVALLISAGIAGTILRCWKKR